jgi:hypothetical protein
MNTAEPPKLNATAFLKESFAFYRGDPARLAWIETTDGSGTRVRAPRYRIADGRSCVIGRKLQVYLPEMEGKTINSLLKVYGLDIFPPEFQVLPDEFLDDLQVWHDRLVHGLSVDRNEAELLAAAAQLDEVDAQGGLDAWKRLRLHRFTSEQGPPCLTPTSNPT